jgi:hypothetical protein
VSILFYIPQACLREPSRATVWLSHTYALLQHSFWACHTSTTTYFLLTFEGRDDVKDLCPNPTFPHRPQLLCHFRKCRFVVQMGGFDAENQFRAIKQLGKKYNIACRGISSGACIIKSITAVIYSFRNKQQRVSLARLSSLWVGSGQPFKHQTRLERLASDKRSSLLRKYVNYGRKKVL